MVSAKPVNVYETLSGTYGQCGGAQSIPTYSQLRSEPRGVASTSFIENLGGACMCGNCLGADPRY